MLYQAAPGDLDPSFSDDGKAFASFSTGTDAEAYDAVYDSFTGKITVAGMVSNQALGSRHIALARFTANGKLDGTFGNAGRVDQSFGHYGLSRLLLRICHTAKLWLPVKAVTDLSSQGLMQTGVLTAHLV
ncbi:hypothetical protein L0222_18930 [bacterium]|nr:hypothetical protein [bacterium]MCI0602622.1 hypothetical protein [bacterium]